MIDHNILNKTVTRINNSLNKRFEKDASLYISITEIEMLKEKIAKNNLAGINLHYMRKDYSAEILTSVLIKNAWLINKIDKFEFKKYLQNIFMDCSNEIWSRFSQNILDDRINIIREYREELLKIHVNKMSYRECKNILDNRADLTENADVLIALFKKVIRETDDTDEKVEYIKEYLTEYEKLKFARTDLLIDIFEKEDMDDIIEDIFKEYVLNSSMNAIVKKWRHLFITKDGDLAIDTIIDFLQRRCNTDNIKFSGIKECILRILENGKENTDEYIDKVNNSFRNSGTNVKEMYLQLIPRIKSADIRKKLYLALEIHVNKIEMSKLWISATESLKYGDLDDIEISPQTFYTNLRKIYKDYPLNEISRQYQSIAYQLTQSKFDMKKNVLDTLFKQIDRDNKQDKEIIRRFIQIILNKFFYDDTFIVYIIQNRDITLQINSMKDKLLNIIKLQEGFKNARQLDIIKSFVKNEDIEMYKEIYSR